MSFMTPVAQRRYALFAIIALLVTALLLLGQSATADIERAFGSNPGCFVFVSFRVPNFLVALETGIVRAPIDKFRGRGLAWYVGWVLR